ncbi:MAG TPA: hypothetical protein VF746_08145 [Longimicrobium sp.]
MPHSHDPPPVRERPRSDFGLRDAAPPARAESPAGSAAASRALPGRRPAGFLVLAVLMALLCVHRALALVGSPALTGAHGPLLRAVEFASLVLGVALVVGLWRCERWVTAAALGWAGALAVRQAIVVFGDTNALDADPGLWLEITVGGVVPAGVLLYVLLRAPRSPRAGR